MSGYVKALRLPIVVMAGLLAISSFRVSAWDSVSYFVFLFVIVASSAIMAHNDWRDREHDAKKGKDFALVHAKTFVIFVLVLWAISLTIAIALWAANVMYGVISVAILALGLVYSETGRIPLLPAVIVAVLSASVTLYAGAESEISQALPLFAATSLLIFGREILKDLDDYPHDSGCKWTIPLAVGARLAKLFAGLIVLAVPVVALGVSHKTVIGFPFLLASALCLIANKNHGFAKWSLDLGMATIVITLLASGP